MENYLSLGWKKVELRETPAQSRRSAGWWCFSSSAAGGLLRSSEAAFAVSSHFPNAIDPWRPSRLSACGGGRGAAVRTHQFAACRCSLHGLLGSLAFRSTTPFATCSSVSGKDSASVFFSGLWNWQLERLPECSSGYSLDLDSTCSSATVAAGRAARPNPRKHGRPSHHPLVACWPKRIFYCTAGCAAATAARPARSGISEGGAGAVAGKHAIRVVRAMPAS